ncbi:hypothetical protein ACROYT_G022058 [Oculina patagonica]
MDACLLRVIFILHRHSQLRGRKHCTFVRPTPSQCGWQERREMIFQKASSKLAVTQWKEPFITVGPPMTELNPCTVTTKADKPDSVLVYSWFSVNGEELLNGELLKDTGHEFVRASRGDLVPPNAVIGGVSASEGTLYLGRVGGNIPCSVSTESGRIKYSVLFLCGKRKAGSEWRNYGAAKIDIIRFSGI